MFMRSQRLMSMVVLLGLGLLVVLTRTGMCQAADDGSVIGRKVDDFQLPDFHGKPHALSDYDAYPVVVVAVLGIECPLVKLYTPRLVELAKAYRDRGVAFIGLNANYQDTPTEIAAFVERYRVPFPVLKDPRNRIADRLGAERTPEVFVLDSKRTIRYRGRIDDQYCVGYSRPRVEREDLRAALEDLLAGRAVRVPETEAPGCLIGRVRTVEPHGDITYSKQIARIFNRRCVECHREKELAPFPLTTYEEVVGWAETIREVINQRRMPPWFAAPGHGEFANDMSMSEDEIRLINQWVENGAPEGDPADLPEPPSFATGWRIGQPDVVFRMQEPFIVPAEGVVDYQYFVIDPGFTEDVWVKSAEARPGNPEVVHHIVLYAAPPGTPLETNGDGGLLAPMVAIYAPGMPPWEYRAGSAMLIRAGSKLVIQMHYTPNGREQQDQSYVGLRFADPSEVRHKVRTSMALNLGFAIPPHARDYEVRASSKLRHDTLLLSLFPHMHYRGKAFRFVAEYPDGTSEILLDVPRYDFYWQLRYDFAEPKFLPKGTRLRCIAHFDNSEDNPINPDPNRTVHFGLQSWEEMMVGYFTMVRASEDLQASARSKR